MKVKCVSSVVRYKNLSTGNIEQKPFPFTIGKEYEISFSAGQGCAKILTYSDEGWFIFVSDAGITGLAFMNMFIPVGG